MAQVKYTQKDIYDRVFKQKRMGVGYDPEDVDDFLDGIISDYGVFTKRIKELQDQVGQLQNALQAAQNELANEATAPRAEAPVQTAETVVEEAPAAEPKEEVPTNLDLIKRVANLERAVFGTDHQA
ncbi:MULTISPECIES: cell division regulator GpsB [Fructobacillus]|uniref:DivIVA domain-containing protein n=1 Tax=Fructobacillus durionis TaxID=283737 RepID=A0A1I1E6Z9_9LACO|nr:MULTISPECIES: cell division regulator GpsB [Fructobacillus]MDD9139276.1 cell division regulator GpsB [Fructobacillus sp. CRL 2054]SFB82877.1 DivIVA domain-containing protein [Fructobacillus durionis]